MRHAINFRHDGESDLPNMVDVLTWEQSSRKISAKTAYGILLNIDEHPEMLPLAWQLSQAAIRGSIEAPSSFAREFYNQASTPLATDDLVKQLASKAASCTQPFSSQLQQGHAGQLIAQQLMPLQYIAGHWLQNYSRVATAHTTVAGKLNSLFATQTMAYEAGEQRTTGNIARGISSLFINFRESRQAREFLLHDDARSYSYQLANVLLGFTQFARELLPEILGITLAWHHLGVHTFVETTVLEHYLGGELSHEHQQQLAAREAQLKLLATQAVQELLFECDDAIAMRTGRRILCGVDILASAWRSWADATQALIYSGSASINEQMAEMIRTKAPCALGYHRNRKLGGERIDDLLDTDKFSTDEVLNALATSPLIVPGDAARSLFATRLVELGGPMVGIFSEHEQSIIRAWIDALPQAQEATPISEASVLAEISYPVWSRQSYLATCRQEYDQRPCSLRELFYKLVNIEYYPDVLPVAEEFLLNRLGRAYDTLGSGERAIPSQHYSHAVLERWVFDKHRSQIDAYEPLTGEPSVSEEDFITSTASLAPLLLIDGGWLQGTTAPHTLYSSTGEKLFRIFFEELGEGDALMHHSNIYRELLEAMGVTVEDVTDIEFAFSERFPDEAYEVPILWLSLSCFTRHYYPELLGINLAVELAGLGASYMEAHDTLKFYGLPTTFVDYHNTTDNASVGHAALSMNTIKLFMNEVAEREGPHRLDYYWRRIWTGMRLTLPSNTEFTWRPDTSAQLPARGDLYTAQTSLFTEAANGPAKFPE